MTSALAAPALPSDRRCREEGKRGDAGRTYAEPLDLFALTLDELVDAYNAHAKLPVQRFPNKRTATAPAAATLTADMPLAYGRGARRSQIPPPLRVIPKLYYTYRLYQRLLLYKLT